MKFPIDDTVLWPTLTQSNSSRGRVYIVEDGPHKGNVFPSITRALGSKPKPFLEEWRKRVGREEAAKITRRAAVRGSAVHKLTECYLASEPMPTYGPHIMEVWTHLRPWFDKHITKVYAQERDVYSTRLMVAGRLDLLAELDSTTIAVVDIKTTDKPKREEWIGDYYLQGSFYAFALFELTGMRAKKIVFPIASAEGIQVFETVPMKHLDELRERIDYFYTTNSVDK